MYFWPVSPSIFAKLASPAAHDSLSRDLLWGRSWPDVHYVSCIMTESFLSGMYIKFIKGVNCKGESPTRIGSRSRSHFKTVFVVFLLFFYCFFTVFMFKMFLKQVLIKFSHVYYFFYYPDYPPDNCAIRRIIVLSGG